jgi:AcrR family transcriptional regulator
MDRTSAETKQRLLTAATEEFAAHGIAGARTGRIARSAGVNEALLFRYFGNKQELFAIVYDQLVQQTVGDVPLDPSDLPAYAGALFDYYQDHEHVLRLSIWATLERPRAAATLAVQSATAAKIAALQQAQAAGIVSARLEPEELLAVIVQLSLTGTAASPSLSGDFDRARRRSSIVAAVEAISEQSTHG